MDGHDELISQFQGIADTTEDRARFYLESAGWQLPVALSSFYDTGGAAIPNQEGNDEDVEFEPALDHLDSDEEVATNLPRPKPSRRPNTRSSKFASIHDYKEDEREMGSDEEEGQEFYAGGSEQSGELIVGPPRKKQTSADITKSLFKEAREHGAEAVDESTRSKERSAKSGKYFMGGGYKLGATEDDSQFIPGKENKEDKPPVNIILRLWKNGFSVDDGLLRDFHDPANADFLNSIKKGQIPRELVQMARGGEVHVDMEDHKEEEFKAPKNMLKAFSGEGNVLGSPAPSFETNQTTSSSSVDPPVIVDDDQPTTVIQIRLVDGKRISQKFNQSHRISDVRSFIVRSNPDQATRSFHLMTTFPNKILSDETISLVDAKLLNALVVQKYM